MEEKLSSLKEFWRNLKKSPGRTYTETTILNKVEYIENLKSEFQLIELEEEDTEKLALKLEFHSLYKLVEEYISNSIKKPLETKPSEIGNTMAAFSLETVSKALPLFAGNFEELESFLITAELIEKTLAETAKQDFLQYVYHAKLTSGVRTAIGSYAKPENFNSLKTQLQQRYKSTKTIPELQSKLSNIYQGKTSVNAFRERILTVIDNLNRLGIEELSSDATEAEKNVIIRLNSKLALDSFKRGINDNLKTAIFAARPKTLQDAVELALELENENKVTTNSVQYIQKQHRNNNDTRHNNSDFRNTRNNFNNRNNYNFPNRSTNNYNSNNNRNNRNFDNYARNNNNFQNSRSNNYNSHNNRNNTNASANNNYNRNTPRSNNGNYRNDNNNNRNNDSNRTNNNRRNIHIVQDEGNEEGSEYRDIPDSQN